MIDSGKDKVAKPNVVMVQFARPITVFVDLDTQEVTRVVEESGANAVLDGDAYAEGQRGAPVAEEIKEQATDIAEECPWPEPSEEY